METLAFPYPPWPDLPDPLLEIILERLPLPEYARFSAVCRRWRSVQSSHRRRHSPSHPPVLRLPWLVIDPEPFHGALSFYSPFENKFFPKIPAVPAVFHIRALAACGWLLMFSEDHCSRDNIFRLSNPISGAKIDLPRWPDPDPIFFYINGKHYYILHDYDVSFQEESFSIDLLVVDPLSSPPTFEYFKMTGRSLKMKDEGGCSYSYGFSYLVESDGEPLLVNEILEYENSCREDTVRYEVFRADLDRKIWVRAESIGDNRALMFHATCSVSLSAADIGATGNCICFPTKSKAAQDRGAWKMFDLGTGGVTDFMLPNASQFANYDYWLFMPSLC